MVVDAAAACATTSTTTNHDRPRPSTSPPTGTTRSDDRPLGRRSATRRSTCASSGRWTLPVDGGALPAACRCRSGLACFRARFEKEAYAETIRAAAEVWGPECPRPRPAPRPRRPPVHRPRRTAGCGRSAAASSVGTTRSWRASGSGDRLEGRDPRERSDRRHRPGHVEHGSRVRRRDGAVRVLADEGGYKIHPSVVSFHPNGGRRGRRGRQAAQGHRPEEHDLLGQAPDRPQVSIARGPDREGPHALPDQGGRRTSSRWWSRAAASSRSPRSRRSCSTTSATSRASQLQTASQPRGRSPCRRASTTRSARRPRPRARSPG